MIIADTSGLLAYFNEREPMHRRVTEIIEAERDPLVVSPYVIAEIDYLVATRIGVDAEVAALGALTSGAYDIVEFRADELRESAAIVERYRDQQIGVADASIVVLAHQRATRTILTLDRRHFDVLRPLSGGRFKVVP